MSCSNPYGCGTLLLHFIERHKNRQEAAFAASLVHGFEEGSRWFWPNAFVRECAGLLVNRIVPEIVWLVILAALFGSIATLIV